MNTPIHHHGKKHAPFAVIIILFGIIFLTIFLLKDKEGATTIGEKPNGGLVSKNSYRCGMTVNSPLPGATVAFPLTVNAIVHNAAATDGCTWTLFEGQSGTAELKNQSGTTLAIVPMQANGANWMTTGPVPFTGTLTPVNVIPSGTPLILVINEEDPSGMGNVDTFSFSVIAQ